MLVFTRDDFSEILNRTLEASFPQNKALWTCFPEKLSLDWKRVKNFLGKTKWSQQCTKYRKNQENVCDHMHCAMATRNVAPFDMMRLRHDLTL